MSEITYMVKTKKNNNFDLLNLHMMFSALTVHLCHNKSI